MKIKHVWNHHLEVYCSSNWKSLHDSLIFLPPVFCKNHLFRDTKTSQTEVLNRSSKCQWHIDTLTHPALNSLGISEENLKQTTNKNTSEQFMINPYELIKAILGSIPFLNYLLKWPTGGSVVICPSLIYACCQEHMTRRSCWQCRATDHILSLKKKNWAQPTDGTWVGPLPLINGVVSPLGSVGFEITPGYPMVFIIRPSFWTVI